MVTVTYDTCSTVLDIPQAWLKLQVSAIHMALTAVVLLKTSSVRYHGTWYNCDIQLHLQLLFQVTSMQLYLDALIVSHKSSDALQKRLKLGLIICDV